MRAVETTAVLGELLVRALQEMNERNDDMTPTSDIVRTLSDVDNTCMECKVIPTNHLCLKCKVVPRVCACCCDENRGLRNNTWCKGFDNETPTTQQIIRDGDYNYK